MSIGWDLEGDGRIIDTRWKKACLVLVMIKITLLFVIDDDDDDDP